MEPTNLTITAHYIVRARQRGYRLEDLAIMERLGTLRADGLLLRERDVAPEIERLSMMLRRIRRRRATAISVHQKLTGKNTRLFGRLSACNDFEEHSSQLSAVTRCRSIALAVGV
jgi:hypothetical protein